MPGKQINLPFYKTKPLPKPMQDFLRRYYPNTDPASVRLHGWSPFGFARNSMTDGNDIYLTDRRLFDDPMLDPKHIFHEFTHKRQYDAGTLTKRGYVRDAIKYRGKHDAIPVEKQAEAYGGLLQGIFYNSPEGRPYANRKR